MSTLRFDACITDEPPSPRLEGAAASRHESPAPSAPRPLTVVPAAPRLSIIVPVFNEHRTINDVIERLLAVERLDPEILVVDDGSTDGTPAELARWSSHPRVCVLFHARNLGKGAAIRTGLAQARGWLTIIQDADLEYVCEEIPALLSPIERGEATVVYGSRYLTGERHPWRLLRHGVEIINFAVRLLYGVRLTDEATCYKVMPTALLQSLDLCCEGFEFCPEVTAKIARLNIPITEIPVSYHPRGYDEGKKIRIRDGWIALRTLLRYRRWTPLLEQPVQ